MNTEKRIYKVRKFLLEEKDLDGFLFLYPPNVVYLSGFKASHAYVIITKDKKYFLTDGRYFDKAKNDLVEWTVVKIEDDPIKYLRSFLKKLEVKRLGFEKEKISCYLREKLKCSRYKTLGVVNPLGKLRMIKEKEELEILKEGIRKTDQVFKKVLKQMKEKMKRETLTELAVRGLIVGEIFKEGGKGESFPTIVASGEASAIPHWESSERQIQRKAPLLIDMGLIWREYVTDFTRTIFIGEPDKEFLTLYEIVKTAWFKGFEKVKAGNRISEIDSTIREYLKQKGLDKYFTHATGHGIGIEVHEEPRVYHLNKEVVIEDGMVFTIEPGLYFEKKYGIRLENIVMVEDGRGIVFSEIPLDLIVLEV